MAASSAPLPSYILHLYNNSTKFDAFCLFLAPKVPNPLQSTRAWLILPCITGNYVKISWIEKYSLQWMILPVAEATPMIPIFEAKKEDSMPLELDKGCSISFQGYQPSGKATPMKNNPPPTPGKATAQIDPADPDLMVPQGFYMFFLVAHAAIAMNDHPFASQVLIPFMPVIFDPKEYEYKVAAVKSTEMKDDSIVDPMTIAGALSLDFTKGYFQEWEFSGREQWLTAQPQFLS